jgi:hypothetical protein
LAMLNISETTKTLTGCEPSGMEQTIAVACSSLTLVNLDPQCKF